MVLEIHKFIQILKLRFTKGLFKPIFLTEKQKNKIRPLNELNNIGIKEVLNKKNVILVFHDSSFRKPTKKITKKVGKEIIFPSVPFLEINKSISASPSKKLHEYLTKNIKIKNNWASLLVGY
ncbi:hypothetical protein HOG16_04370 [Candidatus Woesearchaeota archaeon]|jgi:hypothetical protein|nr:hypothetical protein [Candidatus Woesearchaeota archaeon]MBT4322255.1 hypothetical protein [Candidatus Woesearchaeota archaeon]MBT4631275.1 hypothetical protein [Candidatus Woesearchaeota archaeon]